jgi:hypothetical protein
LIKEQAGKGKESAAAATPRRLEDITPSQILASLKEGVLGQDDALRFVSVAIYKHSTGKVSGNIILIGNSGTGKTTIMNNIQRLYNEVPEYKPFRAMAILNANLLVDSDRLEFRPDRLLNAVEQRARSVIGRVPTPAELKATMERATVCVDEIDKMSSILGGKPNPIGVALQQGLLTLMEGAIIPIRTHALADGEEKPVTIEIDSRDDVHLRRSVRGLYDRVHQGDQPGSGESLVGGGAHGRRAGDDRDPIPSPTTSRSRTSSPRDGPAVHRPHGQRRPCLRPGSRSLKQILLASSTPLRAVAPLPQGDGHHPRHRGRRGLHHRGAGAEAFAHRRAGPPHHLLQDRKPDRVRPLEQQCAGAVRGRVPETADHGRPGAAGPRSSRSLPGPAGPPRRLEASRHATLPTPEVVSQPKDRYPGHPARKSDYRPARVGRSRQAPRDSGSVRGTHQAVNGW